MLTATLERNHREKNLTLGSFDFHRIVVGVQPNRVDAVFVVSFYDGRQAEVESDAD